MSSSISGGPWRFNPSLSANIGAHAAACGLGAYFLLFALIGLQGVLLNLLPPRWFARVTGYLQGLLIAGMLVLFVVSFSIDIHVEKAVTAPPLAQWLPPVWFLGVYQTMAGSPDPWFHELARRAVVAFAIALATASFVSRIDGSVRTYVSRARRSSSSVMSPEANAAISFWYSAAAGTVLFAMIPPWAWKDPNERPSCRPEKTP